MSQNTKHRSYKKYLGLLEEQDRLYDIKNALGYEKLEKPYQHGYNAFHVLRDDISRRKDAEVFQYLLDNYSVTTWSKSGVFYKVYKKHISDNRPHFKLISEEDYEKLSNKYKSYFFHDSRYDTKYWNGTVYKKYRCYLPPHYLVMKVVNDYVTHKRVVDSEIERELDFVNKQVYELAREIQPYYEGFVSKYRKFKAKATRNSDKVNLKKNLNAKKYHGWVIDEKFELSYKRKDYWW